MRMAIDTDNRLVTLWFSKDENPAGQIPENLTPLMAMFRKQKYHIAVCLSGTQSMADVTTQLILRKMSKIFESDSQERENEMGILYTARQ